MTVVPGSVPAAPQTVVPQPNTRLEQLAAQYGVAKAEADKAAESLKAITDGIKAELTAAAPGCADITLVSDLLPAPLRLTASERWSIDAKRLKAENPLLYVEYAKKSTPWSLRAVTSS